MSDEPIDMTAIVGTHDLALITLDTLRHDVAIEELAAGRTPNFAALLPSGWETRHTPATFTYAAHAAFFAGFLPTPARPGRHRRLFALRFAGSETTGAGTCVLDGASIVEGLAAQGYHTLCVGGTGFFNLANPLGRALPSLFAEQHWSARLGVTEPRSFENQIAVVAEALARIPIDRRAFTFVNVSALHQPNHFYLGGRSESAPLHLGLGGRSESAPLHLGLGGRSESAPLHFRLAGGSTRDTRASHAAALRYIDTHVPRLFEVLGRRGPLFAIVCSDHGTLYGEDGYVGHRVAHPLVTTVPYAEVLLP